MYFSSGHMPKRVIPGMLCSMLGRHCSVRGEGRAGLRWLFLTAWDTQVFSAAHRETQERQRQKLPPHGREKWHWCIKSSGSFLSSNSNLPWGLLRAEFWPLNFQIFSCTGPSSPGIFTVDQKDEVVQGRLHHPCGLSILGDLSASPPCRSLIFPVMLPCQNERQLCAWNHCCSHITPAEVGNKLLLCPTQQSWALRSRVIWY